MWSFSGYYELAKPLFLPELFTSRNGLQQHRQIKEGLLMGEIVVNRDKSRAIYHVCMITRVQVYIFNL